jgi:L-threonylcarbamoyladenylate synthase
VFSVSSLVKLINHREHRGAQRNTEIVILEDSETTRLQAAALIARGGVIAFRTDTFYGLGADPFNHEAVQRIKQLKGSNNPILVIISARSAVARFIATPTPTFDLLAKTFWPGPLTLIGQAALALPNEITAGTETVGVRLPVDDRVRALVRACGGALTGTSANPSQREPATTAEMVFSYFDNAIDLIVDGGEVTTDQPSTVLDVCDVEPRLIREGAIAWPAIQTELDKITTDEI